MAHPQHQEWPQAPADQERHLTDFRSFGYFIMRGLLPRTVVRKVRQELSQVVDEIAHDLLRRGIISDLHQRSSFEQRLMRLYAHDQESAPGNLRGFLHREAFFPVFFHPAILDVAELILGSELRLYPNYSCRPKLPLSDAGLVLWHQDAGYTEQFGLGTTPIEQLRMLNVWTPLVTATAETGCMQFIPGSHLQGLVRHAQGRHYLEIEEEVLRTCRDQAVTIEMEPGDVVFFDNLLFHRGLPNVSDHIRWSMDWRYQDARQETMRLGRGFLARSTTEDAPLVASARQWSQLALDNLP